MAAELAEQVAPEIGATPALQTADAFGPELGLIDLDPVNMGRALARAMRGVGRNPLGVFDASFRYANGLGAAGIAALLRATGRKASGPLEPEDDDRRFKDKAWDENAWFFWRLQRYLLLSRLLDDLVDAADLDEHTQGKVEFLTELLVNALSPTNYLFSNPTALKRAFDTGGVSIAKGLSNFVYDLMHNEGRPRQVDRQAFKVGEDLAVTPGKVVFRNDLMELIQYEPQTDEVYEIPLFCSPPWINKYYIMDLAPGRSFIEYAVKHGHTTFTISYRNPDESMRDVTLDDYLIHGPIAAMDVIRDITGQETMNVVGLCLGGSLTSILLAYLATIGEKRVHSTTLLNTLIDFSDPGPVSIFTDEETIRRLELKMQRQGYLEATSMRTTFDMMRANDLIFNYVSSNWLMGEDPPKFDILAWNGDSTNLPAALHSFSLRNFYLENRLARGELEIAGVQIDLGKIQSDVFIVGAENDHIAPWRGSYKTTQLLENSDVQFVLTSAGHIAGVVNVPGEGRGRKFWTQQESPPDPDEWLEGAEEHEGSWWEYWIDWIGERAGSMQEPPSMGNEHYPPLEDAPGLYVHEPGN